MKKVKSALYSAQYVFKSMDYFLNKKISSEEEDMFLFNFPIQGIK